MNKVKICKVGLVFGSVFAIYHAMWAVMVFVGWAKPLMDWILKLHFFHLEYNIEPFVFSNALLLVVVTGAVGYLLGSILGCFWNVCCCTVCNEADAKIEVSYDK